MRYRAVWFVLIIVGVVALGGFAARGGYFPFFGKLMAQVGITVGVAPNPYNTLNDQLQQKQAELDREQAALDARQAALASSTASNGLAGGPSTTTLYLAISSLALILVCVNFYWDWRRGRNGNIAVQSATIKE